MAQKLAPAKKNSRDISPVSPPFCISALQLHCHEIFTKEFTERQKKYSLQQKLFSAEARMQSQVEISARVDSQDINVVSE